MMPKTLLHPVFKPAIMPPKDCFRVQMSKLTVLGALKIHILTEEFQTGKNQMRFDKLCMNLDKSFTMF